MLLTTLSRCNAANYIGAVFDHLGSMVSTFITRKTLNYYFGIIIDEDAHRLKKCTRKAKVINGNVKGQRCTIYELRF